MLKPEQRHSVSLNNLDLRGLNFISSDFKGFNFASSVFEGLSGRFSFERADLSLVKFGGARLFRGDFSDTTFWRTNFEGVRLSNCYFADGKELLSQPYSFNFGMNFSGTIIDGCAFISFSLTRANFDGTQFIDVDITEADMDSAENLTQMQLDECFFEEGKPPKSLPKDASGSQLRVPNNKHYKWEKKRNGELCRKFVISGEWIDHSTPWWKKDQE